LIDARRSTSALDRVRAVSAIRGISPAVQPAKRSVPNR
jgi:hypothetical protein